jgi:hypothetical protein
MLLFSNKDHNRTGNQTHITVLKTLQNESSALTTVPFGLGCLRKTNKVHQNNRKSFKNKHHYKKQ